MPAARTFTAKEVEQLIQSAVSEALARQRSDCDELIKNTQLACDAQIRQARQMAKEHSAECQRLRGELPVRRGD